MSALKIEIDPTQPLPEQYVGSDEDGPQYAPMSLYDAIVQTASEKLVKLCEEDIKKQIAQTVVEAITDETVKRIPAMVDEALAQPLVVTDNWGHERQRGTLRELMVKHAQEQLVVLDSRQSRFNDTVLSKVIKDEIDYKLSSELSGAVKGAKVKMVKQLETRASEIIAKTVTDGLR